MQAAAEPEAEEHGVVDDDEADEADEV